MNSTTTRRSLMTGAALAAVGGIGGTAAAAPHSHSNGEGHGHGVGNGNDRRTGHGLRLGGEGGPGEMTPPLQFAYFRTWHDRATDPSRPNAMGEIPAEVDVAFVFSDYTPDNSAFWNVLKEEYVPTLHSQGTQVVRTADIRAVLDPAFPDTAQGHRDNAEYLVETLVLEHGLDGIDIDMESTLSEADTARAAGVFHELGSLLGPAGESDHLFIYDTNRDGGVPLFQQSADLFDYVLVQSYGRSVSSLQETWETYAKHIDAEKYLIGFSFYEERDKNRWNDTSEPFEESRAVAYADWQPEGAVKGGVFSYAVDRDGVAFLDDEIYHTTYEWTKRLKARMQA